MTRLHGWLAIGGAAILLPLGGCKGFFDVERPGTIEDENLNQIGAIEGIVVGMSYDLAQAADGIVEMISLAAGELWHGGSYNWSNVPRGLLPPEDVNTEWATVTQAVFVADDGLERIARIPGLSPEEFDSHPQVARAYLFAGFAYRMFGENMCEIVLDGGAAQPHTAAFDSAIVRFTRAIEVGEAANLPTVVTAAYAGRASVHAWKGNWNAAEQDAMEVPASFEFFAVLNGEPLDNEVAYETHTRFEYTVFNTEFAGHPADTRAPWDTVFNEDGTIARGANGATPMFQQQKYDDLSDDIRLVSGTEMLVLRAEKELREGDITGGMALLNAARAEYGMLPLATPATIAEAWRILHFERGATTWMENRRLWDMRRWFAETGPAHHNFLQDMAPDEQSVRDACIPISEEEREANTNIP